jgi:hypothetical protein
MAPLPARVRVSRLPLPPAPAVLLRLTDWFAAAPPPYQQLQAGAVALAGGTLIGAALSWSGTAGEPVQALHLDSGWRGRGIEAALQELLAGP